MAFKSLFIGIDQYQSPLISNLSCSARDAQMLHALFGDAFGDSNSTLLTNGQATRAEIVEGIKKLQKSNPEDVIVIGFSGHGSDSHHLITYDADPLTLDSTAIHLDELTELFSQIPSTNLILFLDCCFAGGAGAKVFHAPIATKAPASAEALLQKISGKGRLIFTAATAEQEAIEDRRRGHGLFTFFVCEGLRGAPEIAKTGSIAILSLIEFVTRSVINAAKDFRHHQEPTVKGSIEGDLIFPILTPGSLFQKFFPNRGSISVTSNIADLLKFGFAKDVVAVLQNSIPSLNELQQKAINQAGLFEGQHLVVSAPTSSGKTMIGELAALYAHNKGERSYLLLPMRALVNDKYDEFTKKYAAYGIRVIRSTGEISDDNDTLFRGKFDIALMTYERFAALAIALPHLMRQIGVIVVDEVQMITDRNRGANLEFLLTLLKSQRFLGIEPQLIALSAVIGDTNGFESWLGARLLRSENRPVPLEEGIIEMDGSFRYLANDGKEHKIKNYLNVQYRKGSSQDIIIPLVGKLVKEGEKVIVFRETKPIVQATAEYLKNNSGFSAAKETLALLPETDPSAASHQLRGCLEGGIAFHNADLDRGERQAVESTFRDPKGSLNVLVATTTVAMGVNTPAWSVIIAGLEHPGGEPYSVAEYKNMAGRAGRLGFTPKGKSFVVASSPAEANHLWNTYILGKPEALVSRFSDQDPLSLICRVLATASASKTNGLSESDLTSFIQSTFAGHQKGITLTISDIAHAIMRLVQAKIIEKIEDRYRLTELGKIAGELGIQVESIVRISRALNGLPASQMTDAALLAVAQTTVELDEVIFPVHRNSIQEKQRWRGAVQQQRLPHSVLIELQATDDPGHTTRCKRLSSILLWLEGVELNRMEDSLLQHMPRSNAAGPIRACAERTRDLISSVARIGELVSSDGFAVGAQADELMCRLEMGIPADICWLAIKLHRRLDRGDYLSLRKAGFIMVKKFDEADDAALLSVVNSKAKLIAIRAAIEEIKLYKPKTDGRDLPMPTPVTI